MILLSLVVLAILILVVTGSTTPARVQIPLLRRQGAIALNNRWPAPIVTRMCKCALRPLLTTALTIAVFVFAAVGCESEAEQAARQAANQAAAHKAKADSAVTAAARSQDRAVRAFKITADAKRAWSDAATERAADARESAKKQHAEAVQRAEAARVASEAAVDRVVAVAERSSAALDRAILAGDRGATIIAALRRSDAAWDAVKAARKQHAAAVQHDVEAERAAIRQATKRAKADREQYVAWKRQAEREVFAAEEAAATAKSLAVDAYAKALHAANAAAIESNAANAAAIESNAARAATAEHLAEEAAEEAITSAEAAHKAAKKAEEAAAVATRPRKYHH